MRKRQVGRCKSITQSPMNFFISNYLHCHILYHTDSNQIANSEEELKNVQIPIIKHGFTSNFSPEFASINPSQKSSYTHPFIQTFSHNQLSLSNEETEYSNYLKQYETVIKCSRRKQYISPQKQNKQMSKLINQFLSINNVESNDQTQNKVNISPNNYAKSTTPQVKIDLSNYTSFKTKSKNQYQISTNQKKIETDVRDKEKDEKSQKNKKAISKFININEIKLNGKKHLEKNILKPKDKVSIQVKVKDFKPRQEKIKENTVKYNHLMPRSNYFDENKQISLNLNSFQKKQVANNGYTQSYMKKKLKTEQKHSESNQSFSSSQINNNKKKQPIKIEIQLPLDQISMEEEGKYSVKSEVDSELDVERQKIIKEISDRVFGLLHKSKDIGNKSK